jgi:hypothetical protein
MSAPPTLQLDEYRRRFHRAGLPLFDEDFSASTDVFNRAAPLLALVFLGEMLGAISLEWSVLANAAALLGGLVILLAATGLVNRWRGRPFRSVPEDVGVPELVAFVLVPSMLPAIFGGQLTSALVTAAGNLALLAVVYAVYGYGLISILRWVGRRLAGQLAASAMLLARAVPLLMIFALLAFMSTEMWQVFSEISDPGLVAVGLLFLLLGVGFLIARLPREVRRLEAEVGSEALPLSSRQRRNVGVVLFVSQAVQVLTVALLVAAFFVVFGAIAVPEQVRESWIGTGGEVLVPLTLFGESFDLTSELLKVAGGLAAFSGLYFAIAMLTDSTYREEFLNELTDELRTTFRERAEYLRLRASSSPG